MADMRRLFLGNIKGPQGEPGKDSVGTAPFAMEVGDDGHLYVYYDDGAPEPSFAVAEDGHLYWTYGEDASQRKDLGDVRGPGGTADVGVATTEEAGIVKPDGTSITVTVDGTISTADPTGIGVVTDADIDALFAGA